MNHSHTAVVDDGTCIGNGTCTLLAPEIFELEPSGRLEVRRPQLGDDDMASAREAAAACPVAAITVVERS